MGIPANKSFSGSIFDGSKMSHEILYQLFSLALQMPPNANSLLALQRLEQVFSSGDHLHKDKLNKIKWNGTGNSPSHPTLSLLLLILANRQFEWAKQVLNAIVDQEVNFNWNQTTFDEVLMGKTTPLLYLTMMAETEDEWAEELILKVIDQDIQRSIKNAAAKEHGITVH